MSVDLSRICDGNGEIIVGINWPVAITKWCVCVCVLAEMNTFLYNMVVNIIAL